MKIYQMNYNPESGRLEAGDYTFHTQDEILVLIPDVKAQYRFVTISEELVADLLYQKRYRPFGKINLMDSTEYVNKSWNSMWTSTRIQYNHSEKSWYLEGFPDINPSGLFIRFDI